MADAKTYVDVPRFAVARIDPKHQGRVVDLMTRTAIAAVKSSGKLTLDKSRDGKGWRLLGSLASIGPDKSGRKFAAEVSMSIFELPRKTLKAMPRGTAAFAIDSPDAVRPGDFDAVAEAAVDSALKSALKFMESNAPA
jgi:hypothetical protein